MLSQWVIGAWIPLYSVAVETLPKGIGTLVTNSRHPTRPPDDVSAPAGVPDLPEDLVPNAIRSYASSLRGAAIGLVGGPMIPVLGPVLGLILAMTCWARWLALRDMRRGGFAFRPELEWQMEQAWRLSWASAVGGTAIALLIARDASTAGTQLLSGAAATGALTLWALVILAEVIAGSVAFASMARGVEVWWVDRLQRIAKLVLVGGLALWMTLGLVLPASQATPQATALLFLARFLAGLLPAVAALFVIADGIARLSAVVISERIDARRDREETLQEEVQAASQRPPADEDLDQPIPLD